MTSTATGRTVVSDLQYRAGLRLLLCLYRSAEQRIFLDSRVLQKGSCNEWSPRFDAQPHDFFPEAADKKELSLHVRTLSYFAHERKSRGFTTFPIHHSNHSFVQSVVIRLSVSNDTISGGIHPGLQISCDAAQPRNCEADVFPTDQVKIHAAAAIRRLLIFAPELRMPCTRSLKVESYS